MKHIRTKSIVLALATAGVLAPCLAGCEDDGPLEEAGEDLDEAVEDAGDALEDAGDDVEDALDSDN